MKKLPKQRVVLLGIGHTNAHIVRMWKMNALPRVELVCISDRPVATYSGMLPGVLAGDYAAEKMSIDLVRFCQSVGARLIIESVESVDPQRKVIQFSNRPPLAFDVLSIGIGSQPNKKNVLCDSPKVVWIKPMQDFLERMQAAIDRIKALKITCPKIHVIGGGLGGVEIAFCLPRFLEANDLPNFDLTVVNSGPTLANGVARSTERKIQDVFAKRGVRVITEKRVTIENDQTLEFSNGSSEPFDVALWSTGAVAPGLLENVPLEKDDRGFLFTRPTLQTTRCDSVFAVGDSGTIQDQATPKAGVFAVRQGPVLWNNIQNALANLPLEEYRPQRDFLKLLNTGDRKGIVEYKGFSFLSRLAWKLKDRIDGRFIEKYQQYHLAEMVDQEEPEHEMRCLGCGGKVGGSLLSSVLSRLELPQSPEVLIGLDNPDDCAMISTHGKPSVVTTDFFAAPLDDPFQVGRIAALNALSDAFVMGAKPTAALAIITIPYGRPSNQEELLEQLLAGSLYEFKKSGTSLVGGHTIEGPQLTAGFTIVAEPLDETTSFTKGELQVGDELVLTKPLGSGAILAAHMHAACPANTFQSLLRTMMTSNLPAATIARDCQVSAMTDVTGFGLAGHLLEMLKASGRSATVDLECLPMIEGAEAIFEKGYESTLSPANRDAEKFIDTAESKRGTPRFAALFDPQTCGGVLIGVNAEKRDAVLNQLYESGHGQATLIGVVKPEAASHQRIQIR